MNNYVQGVVQSFDTYEGDRKSNDLEKGSSRCVSAIDVLFKDVYEWAIREYGSCMVSSTCVALKKHCYNGL